MPERANVSGTYCFSFAAASVNGGCNPVGKGSHLVRFHLDMMAKIEVAGFVEGHQMDVRMRHIDAYNGNADLDARTDLFKTPCDMTAEKVQVDKKLVIEVENVVDFLFGDAKDMTLHDGIDI